MGGGGAGRRTKSLGKEDDNFIINGFPEIVLPGVAVDENCFIRLAMTHIGSRVEYYGSGPRSRMRRHLQAKDTVWLLVEVELVGELEVSETVTNTHYRIHFQQLLQKLAVSIPAPSK